MWLRLKLLASISEQGRRKVLNNGGHILTENEIEGFGLWTRGSGGASSAAPAGSEAEPPAANDFSVF